MPRATNQVKGSPTNRASQRRLGVRPAFGHHWPGVAARAVSSTDELYPNMVAKWPQSLEFDDTYEWWKGSVSLPILQSAQIKVPTPAQPRRSVDLTVKADEEGPSGAQVAAFEYLRTHQAEILASALRAIAKWGQNSRTVYKRWHNEDELERLLPAAVTPEQLMERVRVYDVSIPERESDGMAYIEYSFGCAWEKEHGILVVLHKNHEKFCGFTGSGW